MPRRPRLLCQSNIYHVVLRGNNRQQIFEDDQDYRKFLNVLVICKDLSAFELYGYCLMGNHIHLLISPTGEPLEIIFRRIGARFVGWYNTKYDRVGYLFQDRFHSHPIKNEKEYLNALRYIHQNPYKAHMMESLDYPWSSYSTYYSKTNLIDPEITQLLLPTWEDFAAWHQVFEEYDPYVSAVKMQREAQYTEQFRKVTNCKNVSEFQAVDCAQRNALLVELRKKRIPYRYLSRMTGLSKTHIQRIVAREIGSRY